MDVGELLAERLGRIKKAVALEAPDRVPVVLEYAGFAARVTQTPYSEFLLDLKRSAEVMIEAYRLVGEVGEPDAMNYGRFSPYALAYLWLSRVRVPGVDLPADEPYQVVETESMTRDDYDRILREGWPRFYASFLEDNVLDGVPAEFLPFNQPPLQVREEWAKLGVPVLREYATAPPIEYLCGARSLPSFALDLVEIPDKIEAVMDEIVPHMSGPLCQRARLEGYPAMWVGGWRAAPPMLSPAMWARFVWPYFRRLVCEVIDHELIPILHLDSKWDRELERFRELPKGKVIMALDGETDIFRAKEVLGDHLCLMGDVPAAMLCFEDADTVFEYCARLIRELGPEGFILHSGCDIPENARLENVQAMVAASFDTSPG
jgi:hypothetical protein